MNDVKCDVIPFSGFFCFVFLYDVFLKGGKEEGRKEGMNGTGEPIDALLAAEEEAAQARDGVPAAAAAAAAGGAQRTPVQNLIVQFVSADDGTTCGPQIELPATTTVSQMQTLVNKLLENVCCSLCPSHTIPRFQPSLT